MTTRPGQPTDISVDDDQAEVTHSSYNCTVVSFDQNDLGDAGKQLQWGLEIQSSGDEPPVPHSLELLHVSSGDTVRITVDGEVRYDGAERGSHHCCAWGMALRFRVIPGEGEAVAYELHVNGIAFEELRLSTGKTYQFMHKLPRLPVPPLENTCQSYLQIVKELISPEDFERSKAVVEDFQQNQGPKLQKLLQDYDRKRVIPGLRCGGQTHSYIEHFWYAHCPPPHSHGPVRARPDPDPNRATAGTARCRYDSYLDVKDSVVLNLNPFFVLEVTLSESLALPDSAH